jgi:hypothetical protein
MNGLQEEQHEHGQGKRERCIPRSYYVNIFLNYKELQVMSLLTSENKFFTNDPNSER